MKKATILAVSLVIATAMSAVWFGSVQPDGEDSNSPVVEPTEQLLPIEPTLTHDSGTPSEAERRTAAVSESGAVEGEASTELFGEPSRFGIQYLTARDQSVALIAATQDEVPVTRTRILQNNEDAVSRFVANVVRNPGRFDEPVEIDVFPDIVCSLSSVQQVNQTIVPGDLRITTRCDSRPNSDVSIRFNSAINTLMFSISDGKVSYQLAPLGDTGYSLAMEMDISSLSNADF